jgi:hypothetical protein
MDRLSLKAPKEEEFRSFSYGGGDKNDYRKTNFPSIQNNRYVAGDFFFNYEEYGALREGGPVRFFSRDFLGIFASTMSTAIIYATLRFCIRPALAEYLGFDKMKNTFVLDSFVTLPTSMSFFIGLLSDTTPIFSFRRKSYMVVGSLISFLALFSLTVLSLAVKVDGKSISSRQNLCLVYVLLMGTATFGTLISKVATDARVVELSQRETLVERGSIMLTYLITRSGVECICGWITSFLLKYDAKHRYFALVVSPYWILFALAIISVLPIPAIAWNLSEQCVWGKSIEEEKEEEEEEEKENEESRVRVNSLGQHIKEFLHMCEQRAVYGYVVFICALSITTRFRFGPETSAIKKFANVIPQNAVYVDAMKMLMNVVGMYLWKSFFLNTKWRYFMAGTIFFMLLMDTLRSFLMLYVSSMRSETFFNLFQCGISIAEGMFLAFAYVPVSEITEPGSEGAMSGLIMSFRSIIGICLRTFTAQRSSSKIFTKEQIFGLLIALFFIQCLGFLCVLLLPKQKLDAQQLRAYGGYSKIASGGIVISFILLFGFATCVNVLAFLPATAGSSLFGK